MAKWADVLEEVGAVLVADLVLFGIYGEDIRHEGSGVGTIPLLTYGFLGDVENELWNPCLVQFDQWTQGVEDLATSELRLRRLFHQPVPMPLGTMSVWAEYLDGGALSIPDRDGYFGRAARFRFTPLRDYYEPVIPTS